MSFQFLILKGQKMGNYVNVILVADLSVKHSLWIYSVQLYLNLTTGYYEKRDVFVKSQTIFMHSMMYLNGQPSSHQGNQIQGFGCPAFGIGTTWNFFNSSTAGLIHNDSKICWQLGRCGIRFYIVYIFYSFFLSFFIYFAEQVSYFELL